MVDRLIYYTIGRDTRLIEYNIHILNYKNVYCRQTCCYVSVSVTSRVKLNFNNLCPHVGKFSKMCCGQMS